ncbi:Zn(2)-C6 fungal-type domain-containing protein [Pleurotus pulmonarius]
MEEKNTSELPPSLRRHIIRRDQPPQPISHREGRFHDDTLPPLSGGPQIPLGGLPHYHPGHGRGTSVVDPIRPLPGPAALIGRRSPSPGYPSTPPRQPPFASTSQFREPPRHPSVWQEDTGCHVSALLQCLRIRAKYDHRLIRLVMSQGQDSHTLNRHELHIRTLKAGYRSHGLHTRPLLARRDPGSSTRSESADPPTPLSRTPEVVTEGEGPSRGRTPAVRHPRGPRKTEVACNFCRGRKLRCDGGRPSCYNCTQRNKECAYEAQPRRRGPGRAPKGSKSRRLESGTASPSQKGDSPPPQTPISETTQQYDDEGSEDEDEGHSSMGPSRRRGEEG